MDEYLTESEAADYLGLTTRTLRNYRNKGWLPHEEVKGKTRATIRYAMSDIEKLRTELTAKQTRTLRIRPAKQSLSRVSVTVPESELQELKTLAEQCGLTVNDYIRRSIRDRLESEYKVLADELRVEHQRCLADLRRMRSEFAAGFEAVLEYIGLPEAEAQKWVKENLR